jgi:membrane protein YdbS with pleckstrin-like domain
MLTEEEEKFIEYWEANRLRRRKVLKQLALGLPLSLLLVAAIMINFFSGWYKRADMEIRTNSSLILVIVIAAILIVVFTTVFSVRHKWEQHEQLYKELLAKKNKS